MRLPSYPITYSITCSAERVSPHMLLAGRLLYDPFGMRCQWTPYVRLDCMRQCIHAAIRDE